MRSGTILISLVVVAAGGCGVPGRHVRTGPELPPKDRFCDIRVYPAGKRPPSVIALGTVEADGKDEEEALSRLRSHACFLGGDALVSYELETKPRFRDGRDQNGDWKAIQIGVEYLVKAVVVSLPAGTLAIVEPPAPAKPLPLPPRRPAVVEARTTPAPLPVVTRPLPPPLPPPAPDAGTPEPRVPDAGPADAGTPDAGTPPERPSLDAGSPANPGHPDAGPTTSDLDNFELPPLE